MSQLRCKNCTHDADSHGTPDPAGESEASLPFSCRECSECFPPRPPVSGERFTPLVDLDAIRARLDAATPGPREPYFSTHGDPYVIGRPGDRGGRDPLFPQDLVASICVMPDDYGRADAILIGTARRDLRALLAVADAAAAILRPDRGDAEWLRPVEFDDLRRALGRE